MNGTSGDVFSLSKDTEYTQEETLQSGKLHQSASIGETSSSQEVQLGADI